ncbi:MAG: cohesin domain-containing protein, partial [Parcubacteria group bacterium]
MNPVKNFKDNRINKKYYGLKNNLVISNGVKKIFLLFAVLTLFNASIGQIFAADGVFSLEPASGNYPVSGVFSVKIKINSDGTTINAAKATISFPTDFLTVQSISKLGSIFQLWPEEPTFSNSKGTIDFAGGIPAPGFNGAGIVATINFKAKKAGEANVNITGGQILAADGRGTDILSFLKGGTYILYSVIEAPEKEGKPAEPSEKETPTAEPAVLAPEILLYPKYHISGQELFYVEGKALPDATVIIYLKKNEDIIKSWEQPSDENGTWIFLTDELIKKGDYILSAKTRTQESKLSSFSIGYKVNVKFPGLSIGSWMISYSILWVLLIIIIISVSLMLIIIILFRAKRSKKKLKKEVKEARESLENTFLELGKILAKKIEYLDAKPSLNPEEKKLRDEVFYILKNSEEIVG